MNTQQKKYALKRLEEIYNRKHQEIDTNIKADYNFLFRNNRHIQNEAIVTGKAKLKKNIKYSAKEEMYFYFDFPDEETFFKKEKEKNNLYKDKLIVLKKEYIKICDELILGDSTEALKMIEKFEGFK